MAKATLTISSKNYSSWSLRGWLLTKFSGLEFEEIVTAPDDASARAEILLLSSSILVPCLRHDGATIWDTLAIGEYLNEAMPDAGLLPADRVQRAHCRSICGEIHSGFTTLRASLPVNLKGHFPNFKISTGSAPSGASAWPLPAGPSCSANAAWRTPCMRPSSPVS
jgi:glutathione S-transferase